MSNGFYASYAALWLLLFVLSVLVLLLYRHFGLMAMGSAEGIQRDGLAPGEMAPTIVGSAPDGSDASWEPGGAPSFVIFAAPDCEPCAAVLPNIAALARPANGSLRMVAVAEGREESARRLMEKFELPFECIAEGAGGAFASYRVRVTPFAFVVNEDGRVLAKGLCNSVSRLRELLEQAGLTEFAAIVEEAADLDSGDPEARAESLRQEIHRTTEVSV